MSDFEVIVERRYPTVARIEQLQEAIAIANSLLNEAESAVIGVDGNQRPMVAMYYVKRARRILDSAAEI